MPEYVIGYEGQVLTREGKFGPFEKRNWLDQLSDSNPLGARNLSLKKLPCLLV